MAIQLFAQLAAGGSVLRRVASRENAELRRETLRAAMEDSLQIILQSTLMGYVKRQAPDGTPWRPNAAWYSEMKGGGSPNVGPISKNIQGGPLAGTYEFSQVNRKRMMHSLMKTNNVTSGVVQYEQAARQRAALTQNGGSSEIRLVRKAGVGPGPGQDLVFNVQSIERPHLGVATYPRIGSRTDAQWIEHYFGEEVETQLRDTLGYTGE